MPRRLLHFFIGDKPAGSPSPVTTDRKPDVERASGDFSERWRNQDDTALGVSEPVMDESLGIGGSAL